MNKPSLAAAVVAALALLSGCAAAPGHRPSPVARTTRATNVRETEPSQATTGTATGYSAPAAAGALPRALPGAAVPWRRVGPAWALAQYSAATGGMGVLVRPGATRIYLVGPAGKRYDLASWPAGEGRSWYLVAWSDTAKMALFQGLKGYYQLNLITGQVGPIALPAKYMSVLSYTRPDGISILALRRPTKFASGGTIERFSRAGKLQQVIATGTDVDSAAYDSAGDLLAIGGKHGIELASNTGGIIRKLPVPGRQNGCTVVRWWNGSTVLAECSDPRTSTERLWLVPVSGAAPAPLTPLRGFPQDDSYGFDFGDFSGWQLTSGLYLNGFGACGSRVIGRQPLHRPEQQVNVPESGSNLIITATSSRLLVQRIVSCEPHSSLVWLNPDTHAMTIALPAKRGQWGVRVALPGFIQGKY